MSAADYKAVFLSYASQDAEAAKRICDALRAAGVEVWFDQSELTGGDAWDAKIRKQIKECTLFVPVISAATNARREGYFRREWKLAVDRTHDMDEALPFLLPVVIDATTDAGAFVPEKFREVQWTRLPGGETPIAFCERVKKLLGGAGSEDRSQRSEVRAASSVPTSHAKPKAWLVPAVIGVAVVVALGIWRPWTTPSDPAARRPAFAQGFGGQRSAPPTAEKSTAPLTEAQKLVAKARAILDEGDEMNRETYTLAEELLNRAEALDVTEASAWALHAQLSFSRIIYGLDRSTARYEALRTQADRAVQLAPGSREVQLASIQSGLAFTQDLPGVERRLHALAARFPHDWRVQRELGRCYGREGKMDESLGAINQALQLLPDDPRLKSDKINALVVAGRSAEAESAMAGLLQGRSSARLLAHDVYLKLTWGGDLTGAAVAVRSWPAWFLLEDRGISHAGILALWSHDSDKALEIVQRFPRDYIRDFFYAGPRAVLTAWAHEQAGHTEAARADWRIALQVAERELNAAPDDPPALHWKAWALARLGDSEAAASILQQLAERKAAIGWLPQIAGGLGGLALALGRTDDAIVQIASVRPDRTVFVRAITKTVFRLNPVFDPLRGVPRLQALIDTAPGPQRDLPAAASRPPAKSVAVLAFANLSDDKSNEYFSDGVSEELLNVLAKIPGLKVSARTSAFHFKGRDTPIPEIARQLGVAYVIEGSVRKMGGRVRITAQLIKAADGFHVWSENFDRELKDVFAVQDEIAGLIAKNFQLSLGGAAHVAAPVSPEAHRLYLEGRHFWSQRTEEGFARAEQALTRAIEIEPRFARAHAGLADLWAIRGWYHAEAGNPDARQLHAQATAAARRALELDPDLPGPYAALGAVALVAGQVREAVEQLEKSLAVAPNYATARNWHGELMLTQGRLDVAIQDFLAAADLDPLAPVMLADAAKVLCNAHRYAEAVAFAERAVALSSQQIQMGIIRGQALLGLGRREEAAAAVRAVVPALLRGEGNMAAGEAVDVLRRAGRETEAADLGAKLMAQMGPENFNRGFVLLALGRIAEAWSELERAPVSRFARYFWNEILDPVRDDARFQRRLATLKCADEYKVARETLARMLKEQAGKK